MSGVSRRTAIQGFTCLAGFVVLGHARLVAAPQSTPVIRRDITELIDTVELKKFREAVKAFKDRTVGDASAWDLNADTHRVYCSGDAKEVHGTWWFLPWHRAYLHATERNLQKALGDPTVALPYWHWPVTPRVPAAYKVGSLDNARLCRDTDFEAYLLDLTGLAAPSFRGRIADGIVTELSFGGFSGVPRELRSAIEGTPHGAVHNAVGGDMSDLALAAHDPIFFAHHGNIDRLWEVWRTPSDGAHAASEPWDIGGFATDNGQDITFDFFDIDSTDPYRVSMAKTRNTLDLGYSYSTAPRRPPAATIAIESDTDRPRSGPSPSLLGSQSKTSTVTPTGGRGLESFSAEDAGTRQGRAILTLKGVEVPVRGGANLAVYLSKGAASFNPAEAVYAGLVGVVATGSKPTLGNFALDVTDALQRLNAQGETINVTVVSVRVSKDDAEPAPLTVDKIELSLP